MSGSPVYRPHPEAPARARLRPCPTGCPGLTSHRFEIVSRGDFVPGRIHLPADPEPASTGEPIGKDHPLPLLLLQPASTTAPEADRDLFSSLVHAGFAVATIDLPLHGARSSPKLSARLLEGLSRLALPGAEVDCETRILVEEFCRQATSDLIRTLDALTALPLIDRERVGFFGQGIGGSVGCHLLAHDERTRAAVLSSILPLAGAPGFDPTRQISRSTVSSILVIESETDDAETRDTMRVLFEAAPEPRERLELPAVSEATRGSDEGGRQEIERFLQKALGIQAGSVL